MTDEVTAPAEIRVELLSQEIARDDRATGTTHHTRVTHDAAGNEIVRRWTVEPRPRQSMRRN